MKNNKQILRMQQLAGLITESEVKEKLTLNENEELLNLLQSNPDKVYLNTGKWPRMDVKNFKSNGKEVIDSISRDGENWYFWTGEKYKDAPKNIGDGIQLIGGFSLEGTQIWFTVSRGKAESYLMKRLKDPEFTTNKEIDYLKVAQFGN